MEELCIQWANNKLYADFWAEVLHPQSPHFSRVNCTVSWCGSFKIYFIWNSLGLSEVKICFFHQIWKSFHLYFFKYSFLQFFSFPFLKFHDAYIGPLEGGPQVPQALLTFPHSFSSYSPDWLSSIFLSLNLLILFPDY